MDRHFNHEVAGWITKSMSRMDPDEAEMFALFLVDEVYWADRDNNTRLIDRHVEDIHKSLYRNTSNPVAKALIVEIAKGKKSKWKPVVDRDIAYDAKWGKPQPRQAGRFVKISMPGVRFESQSGGGNNVVVGGQRAHQVPAGYSGPEGPVTGGFDLTSALSSTQQHGNAFQESWNAQQDSTNSRTYGRIAAGAALTTAIAGGSHPGLAAAGAVGSFVGEFGPEAEKVIGPAARKTAYRYRGTERTPASELDNLHDEMLSRRLRGEGLTTKDITPELRANAAEIAAITYLGNKLPNQKLAELQLKSGKVPPSQGVMIDADGEIIAEAVGYNEDHYLPFNLKNLKGLKGGAYVRTRSTGGLTTEDIYTGLLGGARSVTVVSRSGVFTLDFDDELRGGRRYSDKAHQMVGRYAHTLDAIKSEQVVREKLSPEERGEIRENVEREMKGDYTTKEIEDEIVSQEKDFVAGVRYSESEVKAINEKAEEIADEYTGLQGQKFDQIVSHTGGRMLKGQDYRNLPKNRDARVRAIKSELMDELRERKSKRKYVLDGEGYAAAMDALQEQYPYFIQNVEYKPYREVNGLIRNPSNERDKGYVMPNYSRPAAAMSGYYAEEIEGKEKGKGKTPANETNYQNWANQKKTSTLTSTGDVAGADEKDEEKTGKNSTRHQQVLAARASQGRVRAKAQEAESLQEALIVGRGMVINGNGAAKFPKVAQFDENRTPVTGLSAKERQDLKKQLKELHTAALGGSPQAQAEQADNISKLNTLLRRLDDIEDSMSADSVFDMKDYDPRMSYRIPPKLGDTEEYTTGAKPEVYLQAWRKLNQTTHGGEIQVFGHGVSEAELHQHQMRHGKLAGAAADLIKEDTDTNRNEFMDAANEAGKGDKILRVIEELNADPDANGKVSSTTLRRMGDNARKEAERTLRMRRIKHVAGDSLTAQPAQAQPVAAGGESDPEPPSSPMGFGSKPKGPSPDEKMLTGSETKRFIPPKTPAAMTVNMRVDNHQSLSGADYATGKKLVTALEEGNDTAVLEHMDALKASNTPLYNTLKKAIINAEEIWRDVLE